MKGYEKLFGKEPENYLYPFFWQHGEEHEVLGEYVDKIYESGMRALCVEARPHPEFVGEKWWEDMDFILAKLKEKGMNMWILDDSHFPTGYANGKIKECYPEYLKLYINCRRYDVQGPLPKARIDLRLLKGRIWDKPEEDIEVLGVYMARRKESGEEDPVDAETLTDITGHMRMEDRLLTVDIPSGAYSIFVVFETKKGAEEATKDYLNPLVKEATQVLIDEVYEPHFAHYGQEFGKTIQGFFSDEPRFGNAKGTDCAIGKEQPLPWRKGLEKELGFDSKYLPLLWTKAVGAEAEFRVRYMDRITALYNENFTEVLGSWCEEHGVWYLGHTIEDNGAHARLGYGTGHYFRGQKGMHAAGIDVIGTQIVPGMNYHHDAFSTGGSNGEFYHYALAKMGTSAAHLDPKKDGRCLCEAFGAYGWNEGLKAMKWIADSLMVRGVNYLVPHAFDPHPFPDWDCPPHFYAHGHNPQFRYFPVLSGYMNRIMSMFRGGTYPARVGLFYPAETEWAGAYMPLEKPCRELTQHQISFDILSRDYLKGAVVEEGSFRIHESSFEALIFPAGDCLPGDLVPLLAELTEHKVQVIFLDGIPHRVLGKYDRRLWEAVREESRVLPLKELGQPLDVYRCVRLDREQKDLAVGEYVRDRKHIYMLFNENVADTLELAADFGQSGRVYRYDAFSDVLYTADPSRIVLAPYESHIYVITEEELPAKEPRRPDGLEEIPLPEEWTVRFADSFSYPDFPETVPLHRLGFVQEAAGFERRAGTARFSAEAELPGAEQILLDLGSAFETAEVFVNGVSAGVRLSRPYVFDLTEHAAAGVNRLDIEITNTLGTQIRDALSHYLPIEPFGLAGDVRLLVKRRK